MVVVTLLSPPLKPVQSQPNLYTAKVNAMSKQSTTIIPAIMNGCFIICCHLCWLRAPCHAR